MRQTVVLVSREHRELQVQMLQMVIKVNQVVLELQVV